MEQEGGGRAGRATQPRDGISLLLAPVCCSHHSRSPGKALGRGKAPGDSRLHYNGRGACYLIQELQEQR